jgi:hypothetical protein
MGSDKSHPNDISRDAAGMIGAAGLRVSFSMNRFRNLGFYRMQRPHPRSQVAAECDSS